MSKEKKMSLFSKKKELYQPVRLAGLIISLLLCAGGIIAGLYFKNPSETEQETILSSYQLTADSNYRVFLLPNPLFPNSWLEEGRIYSSLLTDYIEVNYSSKMNASEDVKVEGEYSIKAIVEGYQDRGNERKLIYQLNEDLKHQKIEPMQTNQLSFTHSVKIRPEKYKQSAQEAESILGGETSRELYLLFEGKLEIAGESQNFSHKILIPISNRENYFEITKMDKIFLEGKIKENNTVLMAANPIHYIPYIALAVFGVVLFLFLLFFSKNLDGENLRQYHIKQAMRKFAARLIGLDKLPSLEGLEQLQLDDISHLISLSEELHKPILFCKDEAGLPIDGKLYLFDSYVYLFIIA